MPGTLVPGIVVLCPSRTVESMRFYTYFTSGVHTSTCTQELRVIINGMGYKEIGVGRKHMILAG